MIKMFLIRNARKKTLIVGKRQKKYSGNFKLQEKSWKIREIFSKDENIQNISWNLESSREKKLENVEKNPCCIKMQ